MAPTTDEYRRKYFPTPTGALFHEDDSLVRGIMGPRGSGKSVTCCMEIFSRAIKQPPFEGIRSTRWVVVRNSYPELLSTTIRTWQEWVNEDVWPITYGSPIRCRAKRSKLARLGDGTYLDMEVLFLAMDRPQDVRKLKSLEATGVWLNEASELPKAVLDMATVTRGRYPPKRRGGATWSGVIMDTNPPDTDSWWYKLAEVQRPPNYKFFRQPAALIRGADGVYEANPLAENVCNQPLGYNYWMDAIGGKDRDWINVYVLGQYGAIFEGKPVYQDVYSEERHVAERPLGIYRGAPIYLGFDFGLTPACVMGQISPHGQLRILREFTSESTGIRQFVQTVIRPALLNEFPGMPLISTGDPAGAQRSQVDELTCLGELRRLGIPTEPAATNDFQARREAVISFLTRMIGDEPGFLIDPSCRMLIRGFAGGYQFSRIQVTGEERYRDVPVKNRFSHVSEALQYMALRCDPSSPTTGLGKAYPERAVWAL